MWSSLDPPPFSIDNSQIECFLKKIVLFEDKDVSVLLHILKVYDTCHANKIFVKYFMVKYTFNLNGYENYKNSV